MSNRPSIEPSEVERRAVLATAFVEVLRPLFVRWADDSARELYERVTDELWNGGGSPLASGSTLLERINELPGAHFDDSHYRDYFVMLALGVVYHAVRVVQEQGGESADMEMHELEGIAEHCLNELDVASVAETLRSASRSHEGPGPESARSSEMRRVATECAAAVDAALAPVARSRGWPVDRVRRPE